MLMDTRSRSSVAAKPLYSRGKEVAERLFFETMAAIDVRQAMFAKLRMEGEALRAGDVTVPLLRPPRVVAFGKAAGRMSAAFDEILAGKIEAGVVVGPELPVGKAERFRYFVGGHPYPNSG